MGHALIGIVLVALGVVLLGDQADLWDGGDVIATWWPLVIISVGAFQLTSRPRPWIGAGIVIAIGLVIQLVQLDALPGEAGRLIWPLVLIVIGGWLLFSRTRSAGRVTGAETSNLFAVFGESNAASNSTAFAGGNVTAILGGAKLDLRQAVPVEGGAEVAATAIFGGAEVVVPEGWDVRVSGLPVFGGVDDQTKHDQRPPDGAPRLTVKGIALFGGVEVKDAP